jgi:hypothetical protein
MIDSGLGMDEDWDWKVYLDTASKKGDCRHALWVFISFVSQGLNMFFVTQYLVIHIEVVFVLHFFVFFLPLELLFNSINRARPCQASEGRTEIRSLGLRSIWMT